jgi:hypothetical protein
MCTVIYIPTPTGFLLSSNRDENFARKEAKPPAIYKLQTKEVLMPVDAEAGGTWIAVTNNWEALVLFNGGFIAHQKKNNYRLSRGIIFNQLLAAIDTMAEWGLVDLQNIEPFSMIMINQSVCNRLVWDGVKKHSIPFDRGNSYIWSSATLYTEQVIQQRTEVFNNWRGEQVEISPAQLSIFLQSAMKEDTQNRYVMNRDGVTGTVSISIIEYRREKAIFYYDSLRHFPVAAATIFFNQITHNAGNSGQTIETTVV